MPVKIIFTLIIVIIIKCIILIKYKTSNLFTLLEYYILTLDFFKLKIFCVFLTLIGIPTSLYDSNLEWDYMNCWPQLQSMVIFGLQSTKSERAKKVAFNFANLWVYTNYVGYNQTRTLFQKVNQIIIDINNIIKVFQFNYLFYFK